MEPSMRSILASVLALLFCAAADVNIDTRDDFTLTLPPKWVEIP
jgi:hypothetical protein